MWPALFAPVWRSPRFHVIRSINGERDLPLQGWSFQFSASSFQDCCLPFPLPDQTSGKSLSTTNNVHNRCSKNSLAERALRRHQRSAHSSLRSDGSLFVRAWRVCFLPSLPFLPNDGVALSWLWVIARNAPIASRSYCRSPSFECS